MKSKFTVKTDFHTHLLPDVDCSGAPESAAILIDNMKRSGIENIVLTPHFYPHLHNSVPEFIEKRDKKIARLMEKVWEAGIDGVNLFPAAEVLLCPGLEKLEGLELLCISGTNTLLIEMPDLPWSEALYDTLNEIRDMGLNVIIAHADRYGKSESENLIAKGFGVQLNADSLCSFSRKRMCLGWIKNGYVYAVGSDRHVRSDKSSLVYKDMVKAVSAISSDAALIENRMNEIIKKGCRA